LCTTTTRKDIMSVRTPHRTAVEAAISAAGGLTPADGPLLELARALARQVDAAGPDGPGTRLAATYLTTIRTLMLRLGPLDAVDGTSKLSQLRAAHQRFTEQKGA